MRVTPKGPTWPRISRAMGLGSPQAAQQRFDRVSGRAHLDRLGGYAGRFSAALRQAEVGQRAWVDAPDRDSCHIVWTQFHEDLLATLGLPRGPDS